jgi:hypothetical protein
MARKWSNVNLPGALHYVTGNVLNRISTFKQDRCCLGFLRILKDLLQKLPCKLITYVSVICFLSGDDYSCFSATNGSTRDAVRAGRKPAKIALTTITRIAEKTVIGSVGFRP